MVKAGIKAPPPVARAARFGTDPPRSIALVMRLTSSDFSLSALTEIGTSCKRCDLFCAVTMISPRPDVGVAGVVASGVGLAGLSAAEAPVANPTTDTSAVQLTKSARRMAVTLD